MLAAQHPEKKGHKLTDDEVIAEMVLFILAGYDTSSNVLTLSCYHFALYPEIQEKVFEEITSVCKSNETATYDELKDMPYLEACIFETLRLYPPGMFINSTYYLDCILHRFIIVFVNEISNFILFL